MTRRSRTRAVCLPLVLLACAVAVTTSCTAPGTPATGRAAAATSSSPLTGPAAWLLASSTDLGASSRPQVSIAVMLRDKTRPGALESWAHTHGLTIGWQHGADWASLSGPAPALGTALGVAVHEYRSRTGQRFYAAPRQPDVPAAVSGEVAQLGRVLNYSPQTTADLRADVPANGLGPTGLVNAYDATATALASSNTTATVVFFEWGPYQQADLDAFARATDLPRFSPQYVGGTPEAAAAGDETELDVEVVHAIAPRARLVVVNANPTVNASTGASVGLGIARLFNQVDKQFPGAVWSLSIGWGCDRMYTGADLQPVEQALETAESHGTSVFDATGDTAGLECKGNDDYSTPPDASDVGVDAIASLPAVTAVGGTLLSTDAQGHWAAEEAWDDSAMSQGGAGGVSRLVSRPSWQVAQGVTSLRGAGYRLLPDVSADADPESGVTVVIDGSPGQGGGTSQAAPIWAGFTVLMDDYLQHHGGHLIGALNPLLYRIAQGARLPAFHDITLGGDAVDYAAPGYDLVTGLGSPMIDNLVQDLRTLQRSGS